MTGSWSLQKDQIFWWNYLRRTVLGEWVRDYSDYWFFIFCGEILFGVTIKNVTFVSYVFFNLAFTSITQKMKLGENISGWPFFSLKTRKYIEGQGKLKRQL